MAKVDLGTKLTCLNCSVRYYDLNKNTPLCPKCGSENEPIKVFKVKKIETNTKSQKTKPKVIAKDEAIVSDIDDIESIDPSDDNVTLVEDDDDSTDDNDVGSVIGSIGSSKEDDL
mgnify:CR=1 FL=1